VAVSILEQIAQAVKAKLDELITSGVALTVDRPTRLGAPSKLKDKSLYLYQDDPIKDESAPQGFIQWEQPFLTDCYVVLSDTDESAVDTTINEIRAQVEKKLREDPTFGCLAVDARIEEPQMFAEINGSFAGVMVTLVVLYRTREDDPYSQT